MPDLHFGWVPRPDEVDRLLPTLKMPELKGNLPTFDPTKEVNLYEIVRKVIGTDAPKGPQKIGDCTSWGWGNMDNYIACQQIFLSMKAQNLLFLPPKEDCTEEEYNRLTLARSALAEQYEECATESIYGLERVQVGGQRGSYEDGGTGIWCSKAVSTFGTMSRPALIRAGLKGPYDPQRAKDWGAKGLPDTLLATAADHRIKTTSIVRTAEEAATLIQNGYGIAICSNRGFTTVRDADGFCRPSGVWNHCMFLCAYRYQKRPGICISQSWGPNMPTGPLALGQPDNTFWADMDVVDYILRQGDSFTGSQFDGYQAQDLIDWKH